VDPVWSKTARAGDLVRAETTFPVTTGNQIALPPGTYIEGKIDVLFKPSWETRVAEFRMHFTHLVFANGYTVTLDPAPGAGRGIPDAAIATVAVRVGRGSDLLLDRGSPVEVVLLRPLSLDAASVSAAAARSMFRNPMQSAIVCTPISGSPGTSPTVIPGTPATPPVVIPGAPGQPDTVIPGTPGTDPVVIPGTAPTAARIHCPDAPRPTSDLPVHTENFELANPARVGGQELPAGRYEVTWAGLGPVAEARIIKRKLLSMGKPSAILPATVVVLAQQSPATDANMRANTDGSFSLDSIRFKGRTFELQFN